MAAEFDFVLCDRQLFASSNAHLQMNQVQAGNELGHGMLYLQPRVHLEEEEVALRINQEFDRARIVVVRGLADPDCDLAHAPAHVVVHNRRWGLLHYFLVPSLNRTLAFAEIHDIAMLVAKDLHLNVPGINDELLDVDFIIAKRTLGFAARRIISRTQIGRRLDRTHALPASASRGFQHYRIADLFCEAFGGFQFQATL